MNAPILGFDVGGAYVKVVRVDIGRQTEPTLLELAFPLWREHRRLPVVLAEAAAALGGASTIAVTMTAELADCFSTKREGVAFVLDSFQHAFPGCDVQVYGTDGQFLSTVDAREHPHQVAAANWVASATLVARSFRDALFVDVGSTTTDIIPIAGGRVIARGRTDPGRLQTGELVYTGALRTPICAIVRWLPLGAQKCRVAAEHFAIAADVHRWLGHIDASDYTCEPPDGRGRSRDEAAARLARMVCADLEMIGVDDITAIAEHVAHAQVRQIASAMRQTMRHLGPGMPSVAVVAGKGRFLAEAAARTAGIATVDLAGILGSAIGQATPAAAVAYLLAARREPSVEQLS